MSASSPGAVYIKHASELVGVSPAVLRAWEAQDLIQPRRSATNLRLYSLADIERLRQIRDLTKGKGLNGAGVRHLLSDKDRGLARPGRTPDGDFAQVGPRLRQLRTELGLSLRETAARSGLSPSAISALERSLSRPSVASLQKLAAALETNIVRLLGGRDSQDEERLVVRAQQRKKLELGIGGVVIEQLAVIDTQLEPLMFRVAPGASSANYHHPGEEFLFIIEGEFELTLGETSYRLNPGDAMTFASHRPHCWRNPSDHEVVVLWINTPPTF